MNRFERWKRETNRKLRRKAEEDRDTFVFHSLAFHKFFEGYKEYTEVDAKGKTHIRRVYEGITYTSGLSGKNYWLVRLLYILFFTGILASLAGSAVTQRAGGSVIYVVLPEIVTVILLFWLFYTLFVSYLIVPKQMTIDDYRSSHGSLLTVSRLLALFFGADALTAAIYFLISRDSAGCVSILLCGAGALLALAMHLVEKKLPYEEHIPDKSPDEDTRGIEVDYEGSKL